MRNVGTVAGVRAVGVVRGFRRWRSWGSFQFAFGFFFRGFFGLDFSFEFALFLFFAPFPCLPFVGDPGFFPF